MPNPNKYISRETAKELEFCYLHHDIDSEYIHVGRHGRGNEIIWEIEKQSDCDNRYPVCKTLPAFSFYEILVTHVKKFFGGAVPNQKYFEHLDKRHSKEMLDLLQQTPKNEYPTKADKYFRENCILISKKS